MVQMINLKVLESGIFSEEFTKQVLNTLEKHQEDGGEVAFMTMIIPFINDMETDPDINSAVVVRGENTRDKTNRQLYEEVFLQITGALESET